VLLLTTHFFIFHSSLFCLGGYIGRILYVVLAHVYMEMEEGIVVIIL
jgi:hypothetical protein